MKTFIFENWHAWEGVRCVLLSDENANKLRGFDSWDDVINFLFLDGAKDAARALNKELKG